MIRGKKRLLGDAIFFVFLEKTVSVTMEERTIGLSYFRFERYCARSFTAETRGFLSAITIGIIISITITVIVIITIIGWPAYLLVFRRHPDFRIPGSRDPRTWNKSAFCNEARCELLGVYICVL